MKTLTIDQVRKQVADGNRIAGLMGLYADPNGAEVSISCTKDSDGWDVVSLTLTHIKSGKSMSVEADRVNEFISSGKLVRK